MCGATLVDRSPAEAEPDFFGRPWLDAPDEWLAPLARDEDEEEDVDEEDEVEQEVDETAPAAALLPGLSVPY